MNRAFDKVAADLELGEDVLLPEQALVSLSVGCLSCPMKRLNPANAGHNVLGHHLAIMFYLPVHLTGHCASMSKKISIIA